MTRVVLVPGFTQTAASWDDVRAALHPSLEIVAVEVSPGASFAETAGAIGDEGGVAHYVGYSMGGRLALRLALDRPDLVRSLVAVSTTAGLTDPAERAARVSSDEALAARVGRIGVDAFLTEWLAQPMFATVRPDAAGLADRRALGAAQLAATLRLLGTGAMEPMWDRLASLEAPVTVVTGRSDTKFTAIGRELVAAIPRARHVQLAGGHALPLEAPAALAQTVTDHLAAI